MYASATFCLCNRHILLRLILFLNSMEEALSLLRNPCEKQWLSSWFSMSLGRSRSWAALWGPTSQLHWRPLGDEIHQFGQNTFSTSLSKARITRCSGSGTLPSLPLGQDVALWLPGKRLRYTRERYTSSSSETGVTGLSRLLLPDPAQNLIIHLLK